MDMDVLSQSFITGHGQKVSGTDVHGQVKSCVRTGSTQSSSAYSKKRNMLIFHLVIIKAPSDFE